MEFHTYEKQQLLEAGLLVFVESISYADFTQKEFKDLISKILSVCNTAPQFKTKLLDKLVCNKNASMVHW